MKELIKRNVFIFIIMIVCFFPASISAKTIGFYELYENNILEQGDVIDFSNAYDNCADEKVHLYLEGELISQNCFGRTQDCNLQYTVQQRMILYDYEHYNYNTQLRTEEENIYFYKMEPNQERLIFNDDITSGYYKTGDIIFFKTQYYEKTAYFYDDNDNLFQTYNYGANFKHIVYRIQLYKEEEI